MDVAGLLRSSRMVDIAITAAAQPQDVASLFRDWTAVRAQPGVQLVLPSAPLHAWLIVLLAVMASDRRRRGLETTVS